ncbi:hypothetical protein M3Y95_01139700 [Aphelenchoides besseyi]|nr:hypothetical protein M3Y95_01139700 [Aphelenchoides besseyi]
MARRISKSVNGWHSMSDKIRWSAPAHFLSSVFLWIWHVVESFGRSFYRTAFPYCMQPKKVIAGKTVLVTGAGGGIGRELCVQLAAEGCRLVLWDLNIMQNDQTAQLCQKLGAKVYCQNLDITQRNMVYKACEELYEHFGDVDIVVNNAGLLNPVPFLMCDDERMSAVIDVNTKALFWTTKAFLPRMLERDRGHIVTVGSVASIIGAAPLVDYAASKFGAFGFMEALGNQLMEQGHTNIDFTTVCPYYVRTPMINDLTIYDTRVHLLDPEYVAKRVIQAIKMRQRVVIVPTFMAFLFFIRGIVPRNLFQSIVLNRRCKFA